MKDEGEGGVPLFPTEEQFRTEYKKFLGNQGQSMDSLKLPAFGQKEFDLYKTFTLAQKYGGFKGVDMSKKWREMAVTLGHTLTTSSSSHMKSAYDRLLRQFEEWLAAEGGLTRSTDSSQALKRAASGTLPSSTGGAQQASAGARGASKAKRGRSAASEGKAQAGSAALLSQRSSLSPSPSLTPTGAPSSGGGLSAQAGPTAPLPAPLARLMAQLSSGEQRNAPWAGMPNSAAAAAALLVSSGSLGLPLPPSDQQQQQQQQAGKKRKAGGEQRPGSGASPSSPTAHAAHQALLQQAAAVAGGLSRERAAVAAAAAAAAAASAAAGPAPPAALTEEEVAAVQARLLPSAGPVLQVPSQLLEEQGGRLLGALLCCVPSQESWALNALCLLSFHAPLHLAELPGLGEALMQLLRRGFPTPEELGVQRASPPSSSNGGPSSAPPLPPRPSAVALDPGAALGDAMHRWRHVLPNHRQLEYRAQAAAAAATVLYNAAAAAPDVNAALLLSADSLQCWMHVLQAAHSMHDPLPGAPMLAGVRWQCQQPFLAEAATSVLRMLERVASHITLRQPPSQQQAAAGEGAKGEGEEEGGSGASGAVAAPMAQLLPFVVALVAPGCPLLPLPLCTAAMDALTAWAASGSGNAAAVQGCCTADNSTLLRNIAELLACPFDQIREQAEEMMVEEGGFPDSTSGFWWREGEEGCAGLREVCIDMATVIKQVRLLASATQLLLRVVSSRAVEVRRSVAVHTRLVKLLAGVAAHDHPGYPLSWQVNPTRAAHLTAIKDRMLPLFEHRSIVLKQARMHATTILASLAFDPATRQYVLPYEAQITQQVMCGRVPADGPMNALLAAFCQQ